MKNFIIFLLLAASVVSSSGQIGIIDRDLSNQTRLRIINPLGALPSSGLCPFTVTVENNSDKDQTWNLEFTAKEADIDYSFQSNENSEKADSFYTIESPAGTSVSYQVLVPVPNLTAHQNTYGSDRGLSVSANTVTEPYLSAYGSSEVQFHSEALNTISGKMVPERTLKMLNSSFISAGKSKRSSGSAPRPVSHETLPEDWRAYLGFDLLTLASDSYLDLNVGQKLAIKQWVHAGGKLVIIASTPPPIGDIDKTSDHLGLGSINLLTPSDTKGKFRKQLQEILKASGNYRGDLLRTDYRSSDWAPSSELGTASRGGGLLFVGILAFAIIVGPINLFVWAKASRRHRLFYTTPIISAAASLLLLALILLKDGIGGEGSRAIAIDVGQPGSTTASVIQEQFSRTGVLFSSSFDIDKNSVIVPVQAPVTDYNPEDAPGATARLTYQAEPKDGGFEFNGDWFQSRSEQAQLVNSVIPSRERLELVSKEGEIPRLTSSFSYPLTDLHYRDSQGTLWTTAQIASGDTVTLTRATTTDLSPTLSQQIGRFARTNRARLQSVTERPSSFTALAAGTDAPSVPTHTSIDWQASPVLVTGKLAL